MTLQRMTIRAVVGLGFALGLALGIAPFSNGLSAAPAQDLQHTLYLDTKDESGAVGHWQCEGGPPNTLTRQGWSKDSLKIGDQVTIDGFRAKDGTNTCNARSVKLPSGKSVFAGSAEDGGPSKRAPAQ